MRSWFCARARAHLVHRCLFPFATSLLLSAPARPALAQNTSTVTGVTGRLLQSASQAPVRDATVTIEELKLTATATADGTYTIPDVPAGRYHLLAVAPGFVPRRVEIDVRQAALTVDVQLDPELHYTEVVSVSPESRNQFDSFQPTNVLAGQDLAKELQATLGATLTNEPGIALRSFGPGPARPVIRGLDGDRLVVLEDGMRMGDLSSQSGDHGVNVNPASASRIEVVRGPASLLYGASAIGGLVNVISETIPTQPVSGARGGFTVDAGSAASEAGGAGDVTVGNGRVALHVSGSGRRASDVRTPGGDIPNSFSRGGFGEVGVALTGAHGYFGASYGYDRTHYGIPLVEEGQTNLNPRRQVVNVRGERQNLQGPFSSIRATFGYRQYRHDELDGEVVATSFKNDTGELEFMARQKPMGRLTGTIGAWGIARTFEAIGEEALAPKVAQRGGAGFLYEEIGSPHVTFQFGGRAEHASFDPEGGLASRSFTNFSGSLGLLLHPTDATTIAFSLARASRNPALEELYFDGAHAGNFSFEVGNPDLGSERARGFDASFRWRAGRGSGEITYFVNSIEDFIFRLPTGEIEDDLPVINFVGADARLQGVEAHVDVRLSEYLLAEGSLDYVRGELTAANAPLPRMPPLRGRVGVKFQRNAFQAGVDLTAAARQERIYGEETATAGYGLVKLFTSYSFAPGGSRAVSTITARLDNVGDTLHRNHLNFIKDFVPEIGRNFKVLYSVRF